MPTQGVQRHPLLGLLGLLPGIVLVAACGGPSGPEATPSRAPTAAPVVTPTAGPTPTPAISASPGPSGSSAAVSPAELGGRLAFAFDDGIWTSDASGANRRRLTSDGGFDPSWSPDGRMIVYRLLTAADDGEIWVMMADGSHRRDLVNDPAFSDWGPAWSPDGRFIAFSSNRSGPLAIWVMNADGSAQRRVTTGHGEYPSWSPDGHDLVYSGGGYYDIRSVAVDGTSDRALTTSAAYDMGPAWAPNGGWIAYHTQADYYPDLGESGQGPEMEIHLVRPDGSGDRRLTHDRVEDSFPAWSPDGRYLAWARHGELVVARADGTGMLEIGSGNFPSWTR